MSGSHSWVVALGLVLFFVVFSYHDYQTDLLQMQEPIVRTCVQHRISQKVQVIR